MQMQEESPLQETLTLMLRNKQTRSRIIKALFEALSLLNLTASVRALEKETRLLMQEERIRIIRNHLKGFQYDLASEQVAHLQIPSQLRREVQRELKDLQVDYWVYSGQEETALAHLMQLSEARRQQVCQMIALETCNLQPAYFENRHERIIQCCLQEGRGFSIVRKALDKYFHTPGLAPPRSQEPPNTLIAESQAILPGRKRVNFVKLNHSGERIALLMEGEAESALGVYRVNGRIIKKEGSLVGGPMGWVTQLKWNHPPPGAHELIGICSYDRLVILEAGEELKLMLTVMRSSLGLDRFLCFEWHPVSEIVYLGGLFQKLIGYDCTGAVATEVNTFTKAREIVFSPTGKLFTIAATRQGELLRYCLEQENVQARITAGCLFMDLKYASGMLVATTKEFIYVIDAERMVILNLIESPPNEKLLKIQAFLCDAWVIIFNHTLRGIKQGEVCLQSKWHNCEAVDISNRKMVTFHTSLRLWAPEPLPQDQPPSLYLQISSPSSSSQQSSEMELELDSDSEEGEYEFQEMIELPADYHVQRQNLI